jgi:predicted AAA+ superfamily ATPase
MTNRHIYIPRTYDDLGDRMIPGRVTVIHGPRRVGKTSLVEHYLAALDSETRILRATGDEVSVRAIVSSQDIGALRDWTSGYDLLFLDEAQRIPEVGWGLKLLVDHIPNLRILATGSSSFDLSGKLGEPLTGRQTPLFLFPLAIQEMRGGSNDHELRQSLEDFLLFGMYPEVRTAASSSRKRAILDELAEAYILKDIMELERLKRPKVLVRLLSMVALQIGGEVSVTELSNRLGVDMKTVSRYLDLLERSFVLYNLRGFSRNLRSEVTRTSKYYFYDNGIRNAVIQNYNPA